MTVNLDCKVSRLTRTRLLLQPGAARTPRPDPSHLPGPQINVLYKCAHTVQRERAIIGGYGVTRQMDIEGEGGYPHCSGIWTDTFGGKAQQPR